MNIQSSVCPIFLLSNLSFLQRLIMSARISNTHRAKLVMQGNGGLTNQSETGCLGEVCKMCE